MDGPPLEHGAAPERAPRDGQLEAGRLVDRAEVRVTAQVITVDPE